MITRAELRDLTHVAVTGIQAMAPGEDLTVLLVVGAVDELGAMSYDVRGNRDDAANRALLERTLETLEQKSLPPAGQA